MSIRILLINPPYPFEEVSSPPLGLIALATYIRARGHSVRILDFTVNTYSTFPLEEILREYRPHLAGATAVTMNVKGALAILHEVSRLAPETKTVMGGPHVTFDADAVLKNNPWLDFVVRGEGELTLDELCDYLEGKTASPDIQGLSFREAKNVIHNPDRPFIMDMDALPIPDRNLAELGRYRGLGLTLSMVTSRGCPHRCVFCVGRRMVGSRVRYFSTDRVLDEFQALADMNFPQINVADDLFTSNRKRCISICRGIVDRGIRTRWSAFARVDSITPDLLEALTEAGCGDLCFGMESGDQVILDNCRKGITLDKSRAAVDMCRKSGIRAYASFILGLPGETRMSMRKTIEFAESLGIPYGYHILAPFPGSEVRNDTGKWGMTIDSDDWDLYDANRAVCRYSDIDYRELENVHDEFYDTYSRRFEQIVMKWKNGEQLNKELLPMVEGFIHGQFIIRLLTGSLLESYPGTASTDPIDLNEDLVRFLSARGEDPSQARTEIERLSAQKCIEIISSGGLSRYRWIPPSA